MKGYIILEKGYEYDDNYYNPSEGGHPTKIFYTKKSALEALDDYEFEAHTERDITDYYGRDNMKSETDWSALCESMNQKYGEMKNRNEPVLFISHVFPTSQSARTRVLRPGFIIRKVNDVPVHTLQ